MTHAALVQLGMRWLSRRCSVVLAEFSTAAAEIPDVIGWRLGFSVVIECKVSRSDFNRDRKKWHRQLPESAMGASRYFLCPDGLIGADEIDEGYGLLWANERRIRTVVEAKHGQRNLHSEVRFLVSMLRRAQIRIGERPLSDWLRAQTDVSEKKA